MTCETICAVWSAVVDTLILLLLFTWFLLDRTNTYINRDEDDQYNTTHNNKHTTP